jgi:CBS domain-containing protein
LAGFGPFLSCDTVLVSSRCGQETDEARAANERGVRRMPQVRNLMVSSVVTIEPGTSVVDAARRMIQRRRDRSRSWRGIGP